MTDKTILRGYEIADILARHGLPRSVNGQTEAVARAILALERERDEARAACPHIQHGSDGTSYCRLGESTGRMVADLEADCGRLQKAAQTALDALSATPSIEPSLMLSVKSVLIHGLGNLRAARAAVEGGTSNE